VRSNPGYPGQKQDPISKIKVKKAEVRHWGLMPVILRRQKSGGSQCEASLGKQFCKILSQKTLHKHRAGGVAQGKDPEFKPQCLKKKKGWRCGSNSTAPV
jgi:hypothetical protein